MQFDNNNDSGITIVFGVYHGTDYTDAGVTLNQWGTYNGNQRMPTNTTTWYTTNDATFEYTGVQLEVGDTATTFEHRSYGEELARCQRYYYKLPTTSASNSAPPAYVYHSSYKMAVVWFPTTMRSTPTCTFTMSTDNSNWTQLNNSESHFKAYYSSSHSAGNSYYILTFEATAEL